MSYSYTVSETRTFTLTHARYIAAKVATDLKRMQRFYGRPTDAEIDAFEQEVIELLNEGYLSTVTYGFQRNGKWIEPTLRYVARDLVDTAATDHDPGRVRPGANVDDADFCSYLTYSETWHRLSDAEKKAFQNRLPFTRTGAPEPGVNGYFHNDLTYSAGGRALNRFSVRSF